GGTRLQPDRGRRRDRAGEVAAAREPPPAEPDRQPAEPLGGGDRRAGRAVPRNENGGRALPHADHARECNNRLGEVGLSPAIEVASEEPMSDEKALLAAIWANPHEDAARLVYADWLQENGQPERAEFIRVQCELAQFDEWDESPRKLELEKREQKLWKKHAKT